MLMTLLISAWPWFNYFHVSITKEIKKILENSRQWKFYENVFHSEESLRICRMQWYGFFYLHSISRHSPHKVEMNNYYGKSKSSPLSIKACTISTLRISKSFSSSTYAKEHAKELTDEGCWSKEKFTKTFTLHKPVSSSSWIYKLGKILYCMEY